MTLDRASRERAGQTVDLLLVANEAQDIRPRIWDAVFNPMAASANASAFVTVGSPRIPLFRIEVEIGADSGSKGGAALPPLLTQSRAGIAPQVARPVAPIVEQAAQRLVQSGTQLSSG